MSGTTPVSALPYAALTDTADANILSQNLATALDKIVCPTYATVGARNTANATPSFGNQCAVTGTNEIYVYRTSWVSLVPRVKYKSADESVTSSTADQDDNDFTFPVEASSTYVYHIYLTMDGDTAGDIRVSMGLPNADALSNVMMIGPDLNSTTFITNTMQAYAVIDSGVTNSTASTFGTAGGSQPTHAQMHGSLIVTTAGTLKLRWAQRVSSGTATRIRKGSFMELWKVA